MELAAKRTLSPDALGRLISALRRFDDAVDHFDVALTATLNDLDELTGLLNRTAMDRNLERELADSKKVGISVRCHGAE